MAVAAAGQKKLYDSPYPWDASGGGGAATPAQPTPTDYFNATTTANRDATLAGYGATTDAYRANLGAAGSAPSAAGVASAKGEFGTAKKVYDDTAINGLGQPTIDMLTGGAYAGALNAGTSAMSGLASGLNSGGLGLNANLASSLGLKTGFAAQGARQKSLLDLATTNKDYELKGASGSADVAKTLGNYDMTPTYEDTTSRIGSTPTPTFTPSATGTTGPTGSTFLAPGQSLEDWLKKHPSYS